MGLLSKIWEGVKNVFKGILKVFEPILKPLGKLMNSKFGKALMIGLSIFTLGTAMVAGYGAFTAAQAAGQGFISAFVEGGKVFLQTLVGQGPGDKLAETGSMADEALQTSKELGDMGQLVTETGGAAPTIAEAGSEAVKQGVMGSGTALESGSMAFGPPPAGDTMNRAVTAGGQASGQGAMLPQMPGDAAKIAELSKTSTGAIEAGGSGGKWLSKAADAAKAFAGGVKDFAMSESGGQIGGALIQGVGNYYTEKDRQEFEDRIRREWAQGGSSPAIQRLRGQTARLGTLPIPSAQDIARTSGQTATEGAGRPYFQRPYGAGAGG